MKKSTPLKMSLMYGDYRIWIYNVWPCMSKTLNFYNNLKMQSILISQSLPASSVDDTVKFSDNVIRNIML